MTKTERKKKKMRGNEAEVKVQDMGKTENIGN